MDAKHCGIRLIQSFFSLQFIIQGYQPLRKSMKQKRKGKKRIQFRPWTPEEENFMKFLMQVEGIRNWENIARRISSQFGIGIRTGKQCRQRYANFIKFEEKRADLLEWTPQEEEKLFQLYIEHGSKWVFMAEHFDKKSANSLKNRFYGAIRKFVRKLNIKGKQIKRIRKQLKYHSIIKTLEYPELVSEATSNESDLKSLKIKILKSVTKGFESEDEQAIIEMINGINRLSFETKFNYARGKSKKSRINLLKKSRESGSQELGKPTGGTLLQMNLQLIELSLIDLQTPFLNEKTGLGLKQKSDENNEPEYTLKDLTFYEHHRNHSLNAQSIGIEAQEVPLLF